MADDPSSWGAIPATSEPEGPQVWGAVPEVQDQPEGIPSAFLDRVASGQALQRAFGSQKSFAKGFAEGFGDEPLGWSPEHVQQFREAGIYRDPATGRSGPIRLFNESVMQPAGVLGDLFVRSVSGLAQGAAGAFGQLVEDANGYLGNPEQARAEALNYINWRLLRGDHAFTRPENGPKGPRDQVIGPLPRGADFRAAANAVNPETARITETNLRTLWRENGVHPAEAAADAANDNFLKGQLQTKPYNLADDSGIAPVTGSGMPPAPRSTMAQTGIETIDRTLGNDRLRDAIDNPVVNRNREVPNIVGSTSDLNDPTIMIDRRLPRSFTIDGITFDPAEPMVIRENVQRHVIGTLTDGGMGVRAATKVAQQISDRFEGAWYQAHGIDREAAEAAYKPYVDAIKEAGSKDLPVDLAERRTVKGEPTSAEVTRAGEIADEQVPSEPLRSLGAEVTRDFPDMATQPVHRPGMLMADVHNAIGLLYDMGRDLQMMIVPMAVGSREAKALAKDFANALRRNRYEWQIIDDDLKKRFSPERRMRMWDASDEESVLRQEGKTSEHMGIATLEPEERAAVEELNQRAQLVWGRMRDLGMVEGEGLPFYTPRMIFNIATVTEREGSVALNGVGANLRTKTANLLRRKYLLAEETEAAAKAKLGEAAEIARDIRATPLALARLEDAIAGRQLINQLRDIGRHTGEEIVAQGGKPSDSKYSWSPVDHPAFKTWRPDFEIIDGKAVPRLDHGGDIIFRQEPIYIRSDFEGPLLAVLSDSNGKLYSAAMALKGKTMALIMNSPLIHNAVEYGRAFPAMPGKVLTFRVYFQGNAARRGYLYPGQAGEPFRNIRYIYDAMTGDRVKVNAGAPPDMIEAIDAGMVPIGRRFFNQDISSIMEEPSLAPGRSLTAKVLRMVPDLFDPAFPGQVVGGAGDKVAAAIDKAGDFWHNTLLWDRVADLQMGLYVNFRDDLRAKGIDPQTSARVAAHLANRYAGALPAEAMSNNARKIANMLMFSRTFTLGNLGVMKDALTGLPRDVMAQIERDMGEINPEAAGYAKALARRKAAMTVLIDVGLFYATNSILQSAVNVLRGDKDLDEEGHGYVTRMAAQMQRLEEHPLEAITLLSIAGGAIGAAGGGPLGAIVGTALGTGISQLKYLSSTYENEPGRQDRVHVGYAADGTGIYARNVLGSKIGEEFVNYATTPLDMMLKKMATIPRAIWQIIQNDAGFGRKIYEPHPETSKAMLRAIIQSAEHLMEAQAPTPQLSAAYDWLVTGDGDQKINMLHALGPIGGVTFSKGAAGGPAMGELYHAREQYRYRLDAALPDLRKQILRGDTQGAIERMRDLGVPPGFQSWIVRTARNPATRLSARALRDFYIYASPEDRVRMEGFRHPGGQP
jgi:hypothetical protein